MERTMSVEDMYFFRIMATMSVPPLEAPMLNMIAELMPGMAMAKISSRTGWSVSGPDMGNSFSAADSATDIRTLIYTVFTPKPFPRNRNPSTSSAILMIKLYALPAPLGCLLVGVGPVEDGIPGKLVVRQRLEGRTGQVQRELAADAVKGMLLHI